MTRGSACASYSPYISPSSSYFHVLKKKDATGTCSVTFRSRARGSCATTTYKTLTF